MAAAAAPVVCNAAAAAAAAGAAAAAAAAAFSICRFIGAAEICFVEVLKRLEGLNGMYWND